MHTLHVEIVYKWCKACCKIFATEVYSDCKTSKAKVKCISTVIVKTTSFSLLWRHCQPNPSSKVRHWRRWKVAVLMHSLEANISCQNSIKICIIIHFTFVSITHVYHFNSRLTRFREINLIGHAANSIITPRSLLLHVGMINLIWGFNLETKLLSCAFSSQTSGVRED